MENYLEQLKHTQRMRDVYPLTHNFLASVADKYKALERLKRELVVVAEPGSYWFNKGKQQIIEHFEFVMWEY